MLPPDLHMETDEFQRKDLQMLVTARRVLSMCLAGSALHTAIITRSKTPFGKLSLVPCAGGKGSCKSNREL